MMSCSMHCERYHQVWPNMSNDRETVAVLKNGSKIAPPPLSKHGQGQNNNGLTSTLGFHNFSKTHPPPLNTHPSGLIPL